MQSAKSIMLEKLRLRSVEITSLLFLVSLSFQPFAQSNSPYSRYGLGDAIPGGNTTSRGMGGVSAAYADINSVNFSNPASFSQFYVVQEQRSKKVASGRVVLDVGISSSNRALIAPNTPNRFTSSDLVFSYLQVGLPLRKNWGMAFGLRPLTRIGYRIAATDSLKDSFGNTLLIDAQHRGSGGSFLPTIGTGFAIKNLSVGLNLGYLFGNRQTSLLKQPLGDSLQYYPSEHTTFTSFGHVFFDAGLQYQINLNKAKTSVLRLGLSGNWKQNLNASQTKTVQTYTLGSAGEEVKLDSVYQQTGLKGTIIYPSSYRAGFVYQHTNKNGSGWLFGVDYATAKWSEYRFYGQADSVQDSRQINFGGQINPRPRNNYFSNIAYRFGFFTGKDYIRVKDDLPLFGASFGVALPVRTSRFAPGQGTLFNLGFEYIKRGNDNNLLKENIFRFSLGLNLSDFWFGKKKYD
ncbi:MAG: hypothetical protein ACXVBF_04025 [Flavisolibacter sp.]